MERDTFDASQGQGQGVHTQTLTLTGPGRPSSKTSRQLPTTDTSPRSLTNRAQITNTSPRSGIQNTLPRGSSGIPNTSPRGSSGKLPAPRVLTDLQVSGRQSNLGRSPSPKVYGRVTPLNLDMRSSPSNQLERNHASPGQIDAAEFEGVSNKQRLPPVSPPTRKKSGKQMSPRQKSGGKASPRHQALVPKSAGAMASLKAAQEALPIVKKDGMYFPKGYTMRPVIPAQKAELIDVARAMNREEFGPRVKKLFDPETQAATEAIKSGVYVGWRCPEFTWDCIRVGRMSRCFCGHLLQEHASYNGHSVRVPCKEGGCRCKAFAFIPGRPEDIGEFWFQRRRNFDPTTWRAKCRCKHTHEQHDVTGLRRCRTGGCGCGAFNSNFLCAACDRHWEDHETVFETETERMKKNIPCGQDYLPFAEMPNMRNMALTGVDDDPGIYTALMEGEGAIPQTKRAITQDSPFKPPSGSGFNPVWD